MVMSISFGLLQIGPNRQPTAVLQVKRPPVIAIHRTSDHSSPGEKENYPWPVDEFVYNRSPNLNVNKHIYLPEF